MASPPEAVACLRHPGQRTLLRCGKCGDPICPRCLVQTPVGVRCPRCVTYERNPLYEVSAPLLIRAMGAGVGAAVAGGALWAFVSALTFLGLFSLIPGIGLGYVIGVAVSASANRKRARPLQVVAGGSAGLAFLTALLVAKQASPALWLALQSPVGLFALVLGVVAAVAAVR